MVSFKLDREPRVRKSIALRVSQFEDVQRIAAADAHGNVSLVVQQSVDAEVERRKAERIAPFDEEEAEAA